MTEMIDEIWNTIKTIPDTLGSLSSAIKESINFLPIEIRTILFSVIGIGVVVFILKLIK